MREQQSNSEKKSPLLDQIPPPNASSQRPDKRRRKTTLFIVATLLLLSCIVGFELLNRNTKPASSSNSTATPLFTSLDHEGSLLCEEEETYAIIALRKQNNQLTAKTKQLSQELLSARKEAQTLKTNLFLPQSEVVETKLAQALEKLETGRVENKQLAESLSSLQFSNQLFQKKLTELEHSSSEALALMESEAKTRDEKIQELGLEVAALKKENLLLDESYLTEKEQFEIALTVVENKLLEKTDKLQEKEGELTQLIAAVGERAKGEEAVEEILSQFSDYNLLLSKLGTLKQETLNETGMEEQPSLLYLLDSAQTTRDYLMAKLEAEKLSNECLQAQLSELQLGQAQGSEEQVAQLKELQSNFDDVISQNLVLKETIASMEEKVLLSEVGKENESTLLQEKEDTIAALFSEREALEEQLGASLDQIYKMERDLASQEQILTDERKDSFLLKDTLEEKIGVISYLEKEFETLSETNQDLLSKQAHMELALQEKEQQLNVVEGRTEQAGELRQLLEQEQTENQRLAALYSDLLLQRDADLLELSTVKEESFSSLIEKSDLENTIAEREKKCEELQEEIANAQNAYMALSQDFDLWKTEAAIREKERQDFSSIALESAHEKVIDGENQIAALSKQLEQETSKLEEYFVENSALEQTLSELTNRNQSLEFELASLTESRENAKQEEVLLLQSSLAKAEEQVALLQTELAGALETSDILSGEFEQFKATTAANLAVVEEQSKMQVAELQSSSLESAKLSEQLEEQKRELSAKEAEHHLLTKQLEQKLEELATVRDLQGEGEEQTFALKDELDKSYNTNFLLSQELEQVKTTASLVQQELQTQLLQQEESSVERARLQEDLQLTQEQLVALTGSLEEERISQQKELEKLYAENLIFSEELERVKAEAFLSQQELQTQHVLQEGSSTEVARLQEDLQLARQQLLEVTESLEQEKTSLQKELEKFYVDNASFSEELEQTKLQTSLLEEELQTQYRLQESSSSEMDRLQNDLHAAKEQLVELTASLEQEKSSLQRELEKAYTENIAFSEELEQRKSEAAQLEEINLSLIDKESETIQQLNHQLEQEKASLSEITEQNQALYSEIDEQERMLSQLREEKKQLEAEFTSYAIAAENKQHLQEDKLLSTETLQSELEKSAKEYEIAKAHLQETEELLAVLAQEYENFKILADFKQKELKDAITSKETIDKGVFAELEQLDRALSKERDENAAFAEELNFLRAQYDQELQRSDSLLTRLEQVEKQWERAQEEIAVLYASSEEREQELQRLSQIWEAGADDSESLSIE